MTWPILRLDDDGEAFVKAVEDELDKLNKEETSSEVRVVNDKTGGEKGSKIQRYDLIPMEPLRLLAELYGKGAEKYAERNWERGYNWSLSFAALQRHVCQFWAGEDVDPETGVPHTIAVAFHAFALTQFMLTARDLDDRPSSVMRS